MMKSVGFSTAEYKLHLISSKCVSQFAGASIRAVAIVLKVF